MSWSISYTGRQKAVAAKIREYAANTAHQCAEPEETIRQKVLDAAAIAAENQSDEYAVRVTASGSMWRDSHGVKTNNVNLNVEVLAGFVE